MGPGRSCQPRRMPRGWHDGGLTGLLDNFYLRNYPEPALGLNCAAGRVPEEPYWCAGPHQRVLARRHLDLHGVLASPVGLRGTAPDGRDIPQGVERARRPGGAGFNGAATPEPTPLPAVDPALGGPVDGCAGRDIRATCAGTGGRPGGHSRPLDAGSTQLHRGRRAGIRVGGTGALMDRRSRLGATEAADEGYFRGAGVLGRAAEPGGHRPPRRSPPERGPDPSGTLRSAATGTGPACPSHGPAHVDRGGPSPGHRPGGRYCYGALRIRGAAPLP